MARRVIEVDGGDDEVGDGNEIDGFGEERQKGDEIISVIVGLVIENYAWPVWWMLDRRHGFRLKGRCGSRENSQHLDFYCKAPHA